MCGVFTRVALALAVLCSSAIAQEEEAALVFHVTEIDKIRAAKGKKATVRGKVVRAGRSKNTGTNFLNFEVADFTVVTFGRDLKNFTKGEPADVYKDKFVEVTGEIAFYKENPQIVLKSPDQIKISEEKPPPAKEEPESKQKETGPDGAAKKEDKPKKVDPRKYFSD